MTIAKIVLLILLLPLFALGSLVVFIYALEKRLVEGGPSISFHMIQYWGWFLVKIIGIGKEG